MKKLRVRIRDGCIYGKMCNSNIDNSPDADARFMFAELDEIGSTGMLYLADWCLDTRTAKIIKNRFGNTELSESVASLSEKFAQFVNMLQHPNPVVRQQFDELLTLAELSE